MRPVLCALLGLLPPVAATVALPGQSPFTAEAHFADERFAAEAQIVLDRVWDLAVRTFGEPRSAPAAMVVHCHASHDEFAAAAKRLGGPDPKVFPGFADYATGTAHLFVGSRVRGADDGIAPHVLAGMTHEAMHLAVAAIRAPSMHFYPRWYVEGVAMWAESELVRGRPADDGDDAPHAGDARAMRDVYSAVRARTLLQDGRVPPATALLAGDSGDVGRVDEYAVFRVLFEWLMREHPQPMRDVLRRSMTLASTPALPAQLRDLVRVALGEPVWATLDERYRQCIAELSAPVPEPEFVPPADQAGTFGAADYHPGSPEVRWASELQHDRMQVDAQIIVRDVAARQTDFVFGRRGSSWLRVCFTAGGGVFVMAREQDGDAPGEWVVLGRSKSVDVVKVGQPTKVRILAFASEVRVDIDGKRVVRVATGKRPFRGKWGMGAPKGCRATWREVRVR